MRNIFFLLFASVLLYSCSSKLTPEYALEQLKEQPEFVEPFYAPFHTGEEILNGDDHKNSDKYIKEHLGKLIEAGLVEASIKERNSWRSVLDLKLTKAGDEITDPSRKTDNNEYVMACRVIPTEIISIDTIKEKSEFKINFLFKEYDVTPFGEHLGFENERTHKDSRTFVKSGLGWKIKL